LKSAAQPKRRVEGLAAAAKRSMASLPGGDPERHPTIDNVNALLAEALSPTEHICRRIAAMTGAPAALVADRPAICLDRHRPRDQLGTPIPSFSY
jgi:hypothetical protein